MTSHRNPDSESVSSAGYQADIEPLLTPALSPPSSPYNATVKKVAVQAYTPEPPKPQPRIRFADGYDAGSEPDSPSSSRKRPLPQQQPPQTPQQHPLTDLSWSTLLRFVGNEMTINQPREADEKLADQQRQRVYNFLVLPFYLERFVLFGVLLCLDTFLFMLTFLPFRVVIALKDLIANKIFRMKRYRLSARQKCDLFRAAMTILVLVALNRVNVSWFYHYIRGQSVMKLYVLFNMLQVCDRLFCSFGEDILETFFSGVRLGRRRLTFHLVVSCIYLFLHSLLLFTSVISLNVSFNSSDSSLFVLMVSNNFVELKGCVFKRFKKTDLFQITLSDCVERVQLSVFVIIVIIQNVNSIGVQYSRGWLTHALPISAFILTAEFFVDWVKHGFICKFNRISPDVYRQYHNVLCADFTSYHLATSGRDSALSVSRRFGFASFPLGMLLLKVLYQAFATSAAPRHITIAAGVLLFVSLLALKVLLSIVLLRHAAKRALRLGQLGVDPSAAGFAAIEATATTAPPSAVKQPTRFNAAAVMASPEPRKLPQMEVGGGSSDSKAASTGLRLRTAGRSVSTPSLSAMALAAAEAAGDEATDTDGEGRDLGPPSSVSSVPPPGALTLYDTPQLTLTAPLSPPESPSALTPLPGEEPIRYAQLAAVAAHDHPALASASISPGGSLLAEGSSSGAATPRKLPSVFSPVEELSHSFSAAAVSVSASSVKRRPGGRAAEEEAEDGAMCCFGAGAADVSDLVGGRGNGLVGGETTGDEEEEDDGGGTVIDERASGGESSDEELLVRAR